MSLITGHWSASGPNFLGDYHLEYYLDGPMPSVTLNKAPEDWSIFRRSFAIKKNDAFSQATDYGTWHLNHDPRDGSANIEIGALCMANATTQSWGRYPFTAAHAWMMAALIARVSQLKGIDVNASFNASIEPSVLMNGPIFNVSTHAERALQTQNPGVDRPEFGYFIYSGDPDCRWDLAVLDPNDVGKLISPSGARSAAISSAAWIRQQAHAIKAAGISDLWGLDA